MFTKYSILPYIKKYISKYIHFICTYLHEIEARKEKIVFCASLSQLAMVLTSSLHCDTIGEL